MFLSSGIIKGGAATQDRLLDTADMLRNRYAFRGYLHLKVMPGVDTAQMERAAQLADRLSVNLEAPNDGPSGPPGADEAVHRRTAAPAALIEALRHSAPAPRGHG